MKNFSSKTNKSSRQSSAKQTLGKVVVFTIVAVLIIFFLRNFLGSITATPARVLLSIRSYFTESTATLPVYLRSRAEIVRQIEDLNEELASRSGDRSTIGRLTNENDELRALLGDSRDERILAGVIARPPSTPYDVLVIDKGSENGIVEGAIVHQARQHAIGIVSRVYTNMSLVTLFSSSGAESTVYLYGPDIFAYAYGEGGGVIRISVPQGIEVHEGDSVVLPSVESGDLGVIERVVTVPTQPEQSAYLTFPIPIQSLHTVTVSREPVAPKDVDTIKAQVEVVRERFKVDVPDAFRLGTATATPTSTLELHHQGTTSTTTIR